MSIPANGAIPLETLIAYYEQRERDMAEEIRQLVHRYNIGRVGPSIDEAELKRLAGTWDEERRIARDTAAWLRVVSRKSKT